jgi:SAM-dependent methyltransferase
MTIETTDVFRGAGYEIAEAIAPTWERRRADIEEVATPVRDWMLRELRPRPGDTVLELAAGVGDTGFEAAAIVGAQGRLISTDFSPSMLDAARRRGAERGVCNVDEYLSEIADTAGPIALTLRGLSDTERADVRAAVEDSFARFAAADGYELPCVALCAVGS